MRLLVITQKVDQHDQVLGFMVDWLRVLAAQADNLEVICLERGEYKLPANVKVYSLGKEAGQSRLKYLLNFYRYIWARRGQYEAVWVHMNQLYIILGWPIWRLTNKKISLWYAHGAVSWSLKLAEKLADIIFTSSPGGFRLSSRKLQIVGQGIDVDKFNFDLSASRDEEQLISVGRISAVKHQAEMVEALAKLTTPWHLVFYGAPATVADQTYFNQLQSLITNLNLASKVELAGAVDHEQLPARLRGAGAFVTMSQTGSLDKAVLEAMASGAIPIILGDNFNSVLGSYQEQLAASDEIDWQQKVAAWLSLPALAKADCRAALRQEIVKHHSLTNLMAKIVTGLKNA